MSLLASTLPTVSRPNLPERSASTAKAALRKPESPAKADHRNAERRLVGQAIGRVQELAGFSLKQFADAIGRNPRQVAAWIEGSEPAQLGALLAVVAFRPLIVVAFSEVAGDGVEVDTVIRIRRRA